MNEPLIILWNKPRWKKPPRAAPNIEELKAKFKYEPILGRLIHLRTGREITGPYKRKAKSEYAQVAFKGETWTASRIIWALFTGEWPDKDKVIDHINGDTRDNRAKNLRLITRSENNLNNHKHRKILRLKGPITRTGLYLYYGEPTWPSFSYMLIPGPDLEGRAPYHGSQTDENLRSLRGHYKPRPVNDHR